MDNFIDSSGNVFLAITRDSYMVEFFHFILLKYYPKVTILDYTFRDNFQNMATDTKKTLLLIHQKTKRIIKLFDQPGQ